MVYPDEKKALVKEFSDASRLPIPDGHDHVLIPQKFDEHGDVLTPETLNVRKHLKRLSLTDLQFLKAWRDAGWDDQKAADKCCLSAEQARRIIKRVQYFKDEDARVKALSQIPTPDWIAAKDVENVYVGGEVNDSQHKSLDRLAKIIGAFKTTEVNLTQNVFNLPALSPDVEAKFKALAEEALDADVRPA